MLRWADRLMVISQSVKDDLIKHLQFPPDIIDVIWGAADNRYKQIIIPQNTQEELFAKFDITGKYIVCIGGDDERKNLAGLIAAYGKLPNEVMEQYQLVIVCKLSTASEERYSHIIGKLELQGRVILTNFVSNEELVQLLNLAALMAFPSEYEGFGLPVIEAWACGTPVLTSNNSSLVQIAGDCCILVNPFSVEDIRRGLRTALTQTDLKAIAAKGQERLKMFQWNRVADSVLESIAKLESVNIAQESKHRIAFFSPLPPLASGIADYSYDIICVLSQYYDIDVFIDTGYSPHCILPGNVKVFTHTHYRKNWIVNSWSDRIYKVHAFLNSTGDRYPRVPCMRMLLNQCM